MAHISTIIELDKIQDLATDMPPTYHHLSETTRLLCLEYLTKWPAERWAWRSSEEDLTDEEWDEAQEMVDLATGELIKEMLTGAIFPFGGSVVPSGFLECDGQAVSRTDYSDLFSAIGTTFGPGDGSTTFNLPDLRGRVPIGQDTGQAEFDTLAETGGEKAHTLTVTEMPAHDHPEVTATATIINGGLEAPAPASVPGVGLTGSAGGGAAHNNLQPYLVLKFIIKF
jgi:microcystin-dependent protein